MSDASTQSKTRDLTVSAVDRQNIEIICPACKKDTLIKREPVYQGLKRVGETLACLSCGHVFSDEASVSFKHKPEKKIFDAADAPRKVKVFAEGEADRICRHCSEYVVNPFIQKCMRWGKIVEATDSCDHFTPRPAKKPDDIPRLI